MKILVTGCMGFIGSNLVPMLLNYGYSVTGLDNLSNHSIRPTDRMKAGCGENWKNFKFFQTDILPGRGMETIIANDIPDYIVHLAALGSVPRSFKIPLHTTNVNTLGFINIMGVAHLLGVKRVVFASSSSVYGDSFDNFRTEGKEGKPLSPYALTKVDNEHFARVWGSAMGVNTVGLRFFNVYGPGQLPNSPYSAVIPKFINEETPTLYGDGETVRDFTYVDDVCRAIFRAVEYSDSKSGVFNVGTGQGTSLNKLLKILGKTPTREPERFGDIKYSVANTDLAEKELHFKARTSIFDGLALTKDFYDKEANGKTQAGKP